MADFSGIYIDNYGNRLRSRVIRFLYVKRGVS
jgi:hypothetical protein